MNFPRTSKERGFKVVIAPFELVTKVTVSRGAEPVNVLGAFQPDLFKSRLPVLAGSSSWRERGGFCSRDDWSSVHIFQNGDSEAGSICGVKWLENPRRVPNATKMFWTPSASARRISWPSFVKFSVPLLAQRLSGAVVIWFEIILLLFYCIFCRWEWS